MEQRESRPSPGMTHAGKRISTCGAVTGLGGLLHNRTRRPSRSQSGREPSFEPSHDHFRLWPFSFFTGRRRTASHRFGRGSRCWNAAHSMNEHQERIHHRFELPCWGFRGHRPRVPTSIIGGEFPTVEPPVSMSTFVRVNKAGPPPFISAGHELQTPSLLRPGALRHHSFFKAVKEDSRHRHGWRNITWRSTPLSGRRLRRHRQPFVLGDHRGPLDSAASRKPEEQNPRTTLPARSDAL